MPGLDVLPLFPLGVVLFPGLVIPLHIFEDRYRALVRTLTEAPDAQGRRFGIVAIREGREVGVDGVRALYPVGCVAQLREVTRYDDGRFDIVTVGADRFRLHGLQPGEAPYLQGRVELLPEETGEAAEATALAAAVRVAFARYLQALTMRGIAQVNAPELPDDPLLLSYLVAATAVVDLDVRQSMLAERDAVARLRSGLALLRRETAIIRRLGAAPIPELTRVSMHPN